MELRLTSEFAGHLRRFLMTSGLSATLSFILPTLLHELLGLPIKGAVATGFAAAYICNFLLLRTFVFKSMNTFRSDVIRYLVVNGAFRLAEYALFLVLLDVAGINYVLAVFLVLTVSTVLKFFGYRRIFR